jgi:hypothetical protein
VNDHCLTQRTDPVLPSLSQENSKPSLTVEATSAVLPQANVYIQMIASERPVGYCDAQN